MTLKQAIESGKSYHRKNKPWYVAQPVDGVYSETFSVTDIIADDWEIEQPAKRKITVWRPIFKTNQGERYYRMAQSWSESKYDWDQCDKVIGWESKEIEVD